MPDTLAALTHPQLRRLYGFWRGLCAGDSLPLTATVDPGLLRPWLANLLIMDILDDDSYVYSFYGRSFSAAFGENRVGQSLAALPPDQRDILIGEYVRARRERVPLVRSYTADFDGERQTWQRLVLPLSSDGEAVVKLMVAAYELRDTAPEPLPLPRLPQRPA